MHQQQTHAAGSLRHAEKRRGGTCRFANRVARASLDAYARSVPPSHRERSKHQTCVAAVVACFRRSPGGDARGGEAGDADADADGDADGGNDGRSRLQVMGLGAGTKFLPDAVLREEERRLEGNGDDACYGKRIRDCHAEVLARRAFRRRVALEMLADLRGDDADGGVGGGGGYAPILERAEGRDGDDGGGDPKVKSRIRYRLRADVTLHFYASSAPCRCLSPRQAIGSIVSGSRAHCLVRSSIFFSRWKCGAEEVRQDVEGDLRRIVGESIHFPSVLEVPKNGIRKQSTSMSSTSFVFEPRDPMSGRNKGTLPSPLIPFIWGSSRCS